LIDPSNSFQNNGDQMRITIFGLVLLAAGCQPTTKTAHSLAAPQEHERLMLADAGRAKSGAIAFEAAPSCSGNACGNVAYRYTNGQNFFKNNGQRVVHIKLRNWAAGNDFDLNPGEEKASFLQVFFSPYEANYK
jgi:hypothetical protein